VDRDQCYKKPAASIFRVVVGEKWGSMVGDIGREDHNQGSQQTNGAFPASHTIFPWLAQSSPMNMEIGGSSKRLLSIKLCDFTPQMTVTCIFIDTGTSNLR
jgi:hypothetical protein